MKSEAEKIVWEHSWAWKKETQKRKKENTIKFFINIHKN